MASSAVFMSSMVGKARSSNFTLSEKLDLLKLVRPHIRILEEHTNKHAVIVDKNKCWDTVAEQYNGLGGDRPHRTAQGLRTLYKRLKESAKQEVMQRRHAQPEYRATISEPTRRIMEMIPHLFHHVPIHEKDQALRRLIYSKHNSPIEHPGSSSSLAGLQDYPAAVPSIPHEVVQLDPEEDVKPPLNLPTVTTHTGLRLDGGQEREAEREAEQETEPDLGSVPDYETSLSPAPSSVNVPLSSSPLPLRHNLYPDDIYDHREPDRFRPLHLAKEEHELVLANHRKVAQYLEEKREGLKRKQELEEELLKAKIKVEKLKAARLRHGLPRMGCSPPAPGSPQTSQPPPVLAHGSGAAGSNPGCSQDGVQYFSVVWCKASKKKHKRWEGDAVLVARGRSVTLKDMEGKDIGKGSGYKVSELASLSEGETLMVGGKEVEVMGVISAEDFARGRCFQEAQAEHVELHTKPAPSTACRSASKPFCPPTKLSVADILDSKPEAEQTCRPRHDPLAHGALVMPRPSSSHQWYNNRSGLPVVDVVVDPHLTTHLRPHQNDGLLFLYECVMGMRAAGCYGAILADEMGLGKTLQSVALSWTLLKQGPYGGRPVAKRILVVTPGSLVQNWGAEFNKWLGRERINVFTVDQDHRVEQFVTSPLHSVLVISYEMLLRCLDQVQKVEFGLIICDEGHRLKNSSIKTSSALSSLTCSRRVILTGTPVQNDLQEFYAIIEFVNPGILGSSTAYRKVYEEPILRSRQPSCSEEERVLGEERASELSRLTGMFILRRTQEIINRYLPPRLDWTVFCEPSPLQRELYKHLLCHRVFRACLQGSIQTHTHLACITALKKLCNHPGLLHCTVKERTEQESVENSIYEGLVDLFPESYSSGGFNTHDSGKLLVLSDLLSAIRELSPADRVVVVSNYTQTLDLLQDLCEHTGYTFCRLDGQTPTNKRQRLVDSFNSPYSQSFLFLLSSKAGGVGLNLIGASHLVLYDIDWNPANDIQAMARVWRDGQKKTVHIYRLLTAGTIEERIFQRQVSKQGLSGTVVDIGKGAEHTSFSTSELRDLFSMADTPCLTHDLLSCGCSMDGTISAVAEEEEQVSERLCQLGRQGDRREVAPKHLSMSELMQWRHYSGDTHTFSDPYLDHARNHITFAFQTTISHTAQ
ncbi:DNA repair and recombination protein RAD54B [Pholidichthys leucotaenia]